MTLETWLAFCATEAVLCLTPGPAVLLVVSISLSRDGRSGLLASLGILTTNAFYFALSATGIGALLAASWQLFLVLKWCGAAYLAWIGLRMLFFSGKRGRDTAPDSSPDSSPEAGRPFLNGVIVQGANPKAIIFFTALLAQFINPRQSVAAQVLVLGVSSVCIEFCVLGLYVLICNRARSLAANPRFTRPLERLGGLLLIAAGARLAVTK